MALFRFFCIPLAVNQVKCVVKLFHAATMTESPAKKMRQISKIGTHNGTFHCDEVLACYMLKQLPDFKHAEIIRTRDKALLESCDIVVDVGGVYDPSKHRYDHHQRSFNESMNSLNSEYKWETKLSSAGLVYYHFGHKVIGQLLKSSSDSPLTKLIYNKIYEMFIEEVDAVDNGISQTEGKPRYAVTTTLGSRVGNLNPPWNKTDINIEDQFKAAMDLVGETFCDKVQYYNESWWPARELVQSAINQRFEVDKSGAIIKLTQGGCPWKDHLFTIEEEMQIESTIKYVLYSDQNGNWRIQCVPLMLGTFENRLSLPEEWRGMRDEELSELTGIPDCVFVHASGFIGGNKTYEGVLEMARKALCLKDRSE